MNAATITDNPTISVPVIRGRMGDTDYFLGGVPFGIVAELFKADLDFSTLPIEQRHQRVLNRRRIPDIARYISDHDDFVFSAIVVSVTGDLRFHGTRGAPDAGTIQLSSDAEYVVNDGQHRVAGICEALQDRPELASNVLPVLFLPDQGLERSQQVFSDLNRTAARTSHSLDILFDRRLPVHRLSLNVAERVPLFADRIDKEHEAVNARSPYFATLSGLEAANTQLLGAIPEGTDPDVIEQAEEFAVRYWTELTDLIDPWADVAAGNLTPPEVRASYLSGYSVALYALGTVGGRLAREEDVGPLWDRLWPLGDVNWLKANPDWQEVAMAGADVVTRGPARKALADLLYDKVQAGLAAGKRPAARRKGSTRKRRAG